MYSMAFRAMNTDLLLAAEGQGSEPEAAIVALLEDARLEIEEYEQRLSRFRADSELSMLNASAGQWVSVSDELLDLLVLSRAYYQETGGLFDPSVLPDLKRVGYDVTLEQVRARDASQPAATARSEHPSFSSLELNLATNEVRVPPGMEIDLGGIAKGWIMQRVAERLMSKARAAAASAGGDMFFAGLPASGSAWRVEVADPRDERNTAAILHVPEGAVVTSSISKRTWQQGGQLRHHIIDPRTGEPVQPEWLSVTVVAPRADLAEAYAKAVLIGGRTEVTRLLLQRPRLAVLTIAPDGKILTSQNMKEYLNDRSNEFFS